MGDEIDALRAGETPQPAARPEPARKGPLPSTPPVGPARDPRDAGPGVRREQEAGQPTGVTDPRLDRSQRLRWARNLGLAGLVLGVLARAVMLTITQNIGDFGYVMVQLHTYAPAIGGAIGGAMAGNRLAALAGCFAGVGLGLVWLSVEYLGGVLPLLILLAASPLGALVGIAVQRHRDGG